MKGYTAGTRTNDALQIRRFRERYILEEGRLPDLTLWIANPHRTADPALRPRPDSNVRDAAQSVDAVYVEVPDLLRQWLRVERGELDAGVLIEGLMTAKPGLWVPPALPGIA